MQFCWKAFPFPDDIQFEMALNEENNSKTKQTTESIEVVQRNRKVARHKTKSSKEEIWEMSVE